MAIEVNINEAKARLSNLVAQAERGEEVIIARANKPVARLVPVRASSRGRRLGEAKGQVEMGSDFDELPEDFMDHFR